MNRGRLGALVAVVVAVLAIALPSGTHGAFSGTVQTPAGLSVNPWLGCSALQAGTAADAVFAYGLDDPEGTTTAADRSGHGVTGTYAAAVHAVHDAGAPCRWDDDLVWAPGGASDLATPVITLPANFAYESWFRSASPNRILLSLQIPQYGSVLLAIDASGGLVVGGLGTEFLHVAASVADDRWHHLILDAGNGAISVWIDGVQLPPSPGNVPDGLSVIAHVGAGDTTGAPASVASAQPFDGELRTAVLYSRVLTAAEVRQHVAAGRAVRPAGSAAPSASPSGSASATPGPTASASAAPTATPGASTTPAATPDPSAATTSSPDPSSSPAASAATATGAPTPVQPAPGDPTDDAGSGG